MKVNRMNYLVRVSGIVFVHVGTHGDSSTLSTKLSPHPGYSLIDGNVFFLWKWDVKQNLTIPLIS